MVNPKAKGLIRPESQRMEDLLRQLGIHSGALGLRIVPYPAATAQIGASALKAPLFAICTDAAKVSGVIKGLSDAGNAYVCCRPFDPSLLDRGGYTPGKWLSEPPHFGCHVSRVGIITLDLLGQPGVNTSDEELVQLLANISMFMATHDLYGSSAVLSDCYGGHLAISVSDNILIDPQDYALYVRVLNSLLQDGADTGRTTERAEMLAHDIPIPGTLSHQYSTEPRHNPWRQVTIEHLPEKLEFNHDFWTEVQREVEGLKEAKGSRKSTYHFSRGDEDKDERRKILMLIMNIETEDQLQEQEFLCEPINKFFTGNVRLADKKDYQSDFYFVGLLRSIGCSGEECARLLKTRMRFLDGHQHSGNVDSYSAAKYIYDAYEKTAGFKLSCRNLTKLLGYSTMPDSCRECPLGMDDLDSRFTYPRPNSRRSYFVREIQTSRQLEEYLLGSDFDKRRTPLRYLSARNYDLSETAINQEEHNGEVFETARPRAIAERLQRGRGGSPLKMKDCVEPAPAEQLEEIQQKLEERIVEFVKEVVEWLRRLDRYNRYYSNSDEESLVDAEGNPPPHPGLPPMLALRATPGIGKTYLAVIILATIIGYCRNLLSGRDLRVAYFVFNHINLREVHRLAENADQERAKPLMEWIKDDRPPDKVQEILGLLEIEQTDWKMIYGMTADLGEAGERLCRHWMEVEDERGKNHCYTCEDSEGCPYLEQLRDVQGSIIAHYNILLTQSYADVAAGDCLNNPDLIVMDEDFLDNCFKESVITRKDLEWAITRLKDNNPGIDEVRELLKFALQELTKPGAAATEYRKSINFIAGVSSRINYSTRVTRDNIIEGLRSLQREDPNWHVRYLQRSSREYATRRRALNIRHLVEGLIYALRDSKEIQYGLIVDRNQKLTVIHYFPPPLLRPTLILDATAEDELYRRMRADIANQVILPADSGRQNPIKDYRMVDISLQPQNVLIQVIDRKVGMNEAWVEKKALKEDTLLPIMERLIKMHRKKKKLKVGLISYQSLMAVGNKVEGYKPGPLLIELRGRVKRIANVEGGYYWNLRGSNSMEKVDLLFVIGNPYPNFAKIQAQAAAMFPELGGYVGYGFSPATIRQRLREPELVDDELNIIRPNEPDNEVEVNIQVFENPQAQALFSRKSSAELYQAIFRSRPLSNDPCVIYYFGQLPVPGWEPDILLDYDDLMLKFMPEKVLEKYTAADTLAHFYSTLSKNEQRSIRQADLVKLSGIDKQRVSELFERLKDNYGK